MLNLILLKNYLIRKIDADLGDLIARKAKSTHSLESKCLILSLEYAMNQIADITTITLLRIELEQSAAPKDQPENQFEAND